MKISRLALALGFSAAACRKKRLILYPDSIPEFLDWLHKKGGKKIGGGAGFNGEWAVEVKPPGRGAMWLEIRGAGGDDIQGRFVGGVGGRSQPLLDAEIREGALRFRVERYFEHSQTWGTATTTARLAGDGMEGVTRRHGGPEIRWSGRRPDVVSDHDDGSWKPAAPIILFDGGDLSLWRSTKGKDGQWVVLDGVLRNQGKAPNLVTVRKFLNFQLHVEFRVAAGSNSGIGLRSRYEVQILDDYGQPAGIHGNGAVYSTIKPAVNASRPPESRQTFDITLIGRDVTVTLNGRRIIDKQTIRGLTAMAADASEADPGPLALQGDHGPVEFYRIVLTPLAR